MPFFYVKHGDSKDCLYNESLCNEIGYFFQQKNPTLEMGAF